MCSYNTKSFRNVYQTVRNLHHLPSYRCRFDTGRLHTLPATHKSSRRNENDAVRQFILSIDVETASVAQQVYSYRKCEVEMTDSDFLQFRLGPEQKKGLRRLNSVVVDAKVIPLLKDGGVCTDVHDLLHATTGLKPVIVRTRVNQSAVKNFIKLVRSCIGSARRMVFQENGNAANRSEDYVIEEECLFIRLGAMKKHASTKNQCTRAKVN